MKLNYGHEVFTLPAAVLTQMDKTDAKHLLVLLWLASDVTLAKKKSQLAKLCDCDTKTVTDAIAFWQERGLLVEDTQTVAAMVTVEPSAEVKSLDADTEGAAAKPSRKKLVQRADVLPTYTSNELTEMLEKRASARALINEGQQILGKIFNTAEVNILLGMLDYLGMDEECILLLLAHCERIGKKNLRSIEKYAYTLVDKGITEHYALEEEIRTIEAMHSFEGEVRSMFGMKGRALTTKEGKMLRAWHSFGYGIDVVRLAYEITIAAINEPSVQYANAILENWNKDGLRTVEQIQAAVEERQAKKEGKQKDATPTLGSSFDADDFFEAALKRSFEQMGIED